MYIDKFNRDEIFDRLCVEKSEELLGMIKETKNPNFQDSIGVSYLHMACQAHYVEAVKILLENGANPNIRDNRGRLAILAALDGSQEGIENFPKILELMLQYGLDLEQMTVYTGTVKETIESFKRDTYNAVIDRYYRGEILRNK